MNIKIEDFSKIDLRIGKIIEVKDHPNANKLYVLVVDIGSDKKQIVAGIKEHYKKEELIGKKVLVVVNLEPKNIRGILSEGMILAAEKNDKLTLIIPDKDIEEGAKVY